MFSKKKTECRVCGYRFTPERENIYTAEEPRSALEMLTAAPTRFRRLIARFAVVKSGWRIVRRALTFQRLRNSTTRTQRKRRAAKMKIKSIAAICKKNKNIAIFERYSDDGDILTQYIGDGSAVYPVVGLPRLDKESLLTIFDVPEKDRDNYFVKTLGVPAGISFEDTDETERHVEREGISIIYSGRTLKPIRTTRGLVFIESRYLSPVADVLDVLELYERRTAEGTPYIVAKAGFLLQAVIMPYDVINQQFVESLQDLTRECEFSLSEKERREREARDRFTFTEPEQCSLNVDPDTGEVVEESEVADNA